MVRLATLIHFLIHTHPSQEFLSHDAALYGRISRPARSISWLGTKCYSLGHCSLIHSLIPTNSEHMAWRLTMIHSIWHDILVSKLRTAHKSPSTPWGKLYILNRTCRQNGRRPIYLLSYSQTKHGTPQRKICGDDGRAVNLLRCVLYDLWSP